MLNTTTMHGFKAAAKNLKKSLLRYETEVSLSSAKNILAQALGVKNYNTISVEVKKLEAQQTSLNRKIEGVVELTNSLPDAFKSRDFETAIFSMQNVIDKLNRSYRHYRDENNCFLYFF